MSKSILKNVLYKTILSIFNIIIPIIVTTYLYRVMNAEIMGRVDFSDSIYVYFMIFAVFGIYTYGLREVSRCRNDTKQLRKLFSSLFVIGLIANLIAVGVYIPFIFIKYGNTSIFSVLFIYTFTILFNIFYVEWVNEGLENYDFITIKTIIVRIIYIILLFALVKSQNDYLIYVCLISFSVFLNNIISFFYIVKNVGLDFNDISIKRHMKYLLTAVVLCNANILYTQIDKIMLGSYVSYSAVSFYALGQKIMIIINALIMVVVQVTIPRLSNYLGNEDENAYIFLLQLISKNFFAFLFPVTIGIFSLANEIVTMFGGHKFAAAGSVLKIFAIYMIACGIDSILSNQVLYVKKKEKVLTIFLLACGVLNLILNILLIKLHIFNQVSAIATTSIATFLLIGLEYFYTKKVLKLDYNLFSMDKIKYFFISLPFIPFSIMVRYITTNTVIISLITIIISVTYYCAVLYLIKDEVLIGLLKRLKIIR